MDLAPYVEELRHELLVAAEAGGAEARAVAERLTASLESTARLVLLDALSAAANEITSELAPGSVDVRLRGRDPEFVVTSPPAEQEFAAAASVGARPLPPGAADADDGGNARITLRLGDHLKTRIEAAAAGEGMSVNAWLVRTVAAAVDPRGGAPVGDRRGSSATGVPSSGQRFTGWAR